MALVESTGVESDLMLRQCSSCGAEKPATTDYFRGYTSSGGKHLLRQKCRKCEGYKFEGADRCIEISSAKVAAASLGGRLRRKYSPEQSREIARARCRAYYRKNKDEVLRKFREARKQNPEKHRQRDKDYHKKNKAAGSEYQKRRYARLDKVKAAADVVHWKKNNPERVKEHWRRTYAKNKSKRLAYGYKWAKENVEARIAIRDRRRAREFGAAGVYTKDDVKALLKRTGRVCFYCNEPLRKFHCDHFIPLARGGSNDPSNLRLSCPSCNFSKAARLPWEWKPERFSPPPQ